MVNKVTTQGDLVIKADIARQLFGFDGKGIKIGIISDSFNSLSGLSENVKSGDLPGKANPFGYGQPVTILADTNEPLLDEGRALGQIIHDIAPGAELFFHTFTEEDQDGLFSDEESFAKAVSALTAAEVDIIVEDAVVAAPLLQDGKAAKAIEAAADQGVIVVSAAGNDGGISYESVFRPGAEFEIEGFQFQAHDFDPTDDVDFFQNINLPEGNTLISPLLGWDDPIGEIETEYIQLLVNTPELPSLDNIVAVSGFISESALDAPLQGLLYAPEKDEQLYFVIAKVGDNIPEEPTVIKWVSNANGADRTIDYEYIDEDANNRSVYGHRNAPSSITVGATNIENPTEVRDYSSRGGSPIWFDSEGNKLTNPILRNKPEIYAPDGVATNFPIDSPFSEFSGSSASVPHIGGIVALMLERAGQELSPERVRSVLQSTSIPITEDAGLAQADLAVIESFVSAQTGTEANDNLQGTSLADNLYGKEGADLLAGELGNDVLYGDAGDDTLRGDQNNRASGGSTGGNDIIFGGSGNDRIGGKGGDDRLFGDENDDIIFGDDGDDLLWGGLGNDTLTGDDFSGGSGSDTFVLAVGEGTDTIVDFQIGTDLIGLADGLTFEQLSIEETDNALISFQNETLAILEGVTAGTLDESAFILV